jgi:tetratricopeptide (TPR) repeat protein
MGPMTRTDIRRGLESRVEHMFGVIAARIEKKQNTLDSYLPILEGIARSYPKAWWLLAELHEEQFTPGCLINAKNAVEQFLQNAPASLVTSYTWRKLAELCQRTEDALGEINASVETCQYPNIPFHIIKNAANRLNRLMANKLKLDTSEKNILVQKLADVMSSRVSEATDASDLSSLAWLYMHLDKRDKAREYAEMGLTMEPNHIYSKRLLAIIENE